MAEQSRHGAIAAQGGAVYFHERTGNLVPVLLEVINAPRQLGFSGASGTGKKNWPLRVDGHVLNFLHQRIEPGIARFNP